MRGIHPTQTKRSDFALVRKNGGADAKPCRLRRCDAEQAHSDAFPLWRFFAYFLIVQKVGPRRETGSVCARVRCEISHGGPRVAALQGDGTCCPLLVGRGPVPRRAMGTATRGVVRRMRLQPRAGCRGRQPLRKDAISPFCFVGDGVLDVPMQQGWTQTNPRHFPAGAGGWYPPLQGAEVVVSGSTSSGTAGAKPPALRPSGKPEPDSSRMGF